MTAPKITPKHLERAAYVYIRQSSLGQVQENLESRRRQYELADRARALGWCRVEVVDEDLGRSGSGRVERPGFQRLVSAVCLEEVGAVFALEASRLARNNRDWHHLVDLCGLTSTLIIDAEGVYDPHHFNDRLLLGLKGTMSEWELGVMRQRSLVALREKAERGELYTMLPVGFLRTRADRCEMDPDRRIRTSISLVFEKRSWEASGRSFSGSGRKESSFPASSTVPSAAAWPGSFRSMARCTRSSPIPFTRAHTRTGGPARKPRSWTAGREDAGGSRCRRTSGPS